MLTALDLILSLVVAGSILSILRLAGTQALIAIRVRIELRRRKALGRRLANPKDLKQ